MEEINPLRVLAKALVIFVVLNLVYASVDPPVGRLSIYTWLVKGRERFPRGGPPGRYNLSPEDLDASFAAHVISSPRRGPAEYRVVVLGDSGTWGPFLSPPETFVGRLNGAHLSVCGKDIRFFNLAYPKPNALKDFIILSKAREYEPDLVVWMLKHASIVINAPPPVWGSESGEALSTVLHQYGLDRYRKYIDPPPTFWERTLVGQRSRLAKIALLQAYGPLWDATGVDESEIRYVPVAQNRVPVPSSVVDEPGTSVVVDPSNLEFDVLAAAGEMMEPVPVLIVSEPIYLATKRGPEQLKRGIELRLMHDQVRRLLQDFAARQGWSYMDLSALVPPEEFTNSIVHVNASGEKRIANALLPEIRRIACP